MTATTRILTCSQNRRLNIINYNDDDSMMQTSKPKQSMIKSIVDSKEKLSIVSENVNEWTAIQKVPFNPSMESDCDGESQRAPIFRQQSNLDDIESLLVLKRANPVYDSDDEEFPQSPSKRQRTSDRSQIFWSDRVQEDESEGFILSMSFLRSH